MEKQKTAFGIFNVVDPAEEGTKIDLVAPDGKPTEHWIVVRGADSRFFTEALAISKRRVAQAYSQDKDIGEQELSKLLSENQNWLIAHLIKDWSNDEELTISSAERFLETAPQIAEQINKFAAERENFRSENFD